MVVGCLCGSFIRRRFREQQSKSENSAEHRTSPSPTGLTSPEPTPSVSREVSETHHRNGSSTTQLPANGIAGTHQLSQTLPRSDLNHARTGSTAGSVPISSATANPSPTSVGSTLVPKTVLCQLTLKYDGKTYDNFEAHIPWNDSFKETFAAFNKSALQSLQQHDEPRSNSLYRKSGRCRLIRDDNGFVYDSKILENEQQWSEVLPFLVSSFCPRYPYVKFHLEIVWEYSDLYVPSVPGEKYQITIKKKLHSKSLKNWQNKMFIPRKDLDEILRDSTIRQLVKRDESLSALASQAANDPYAYDEETFINDVTNSASRLFALCIYEDLPLACLYRLIKPNKEGSSDGFRDVDLPLKEEDCPDQNYKVEFSKLVERQGGFKAHLFERPERTNPRPIHYTLTDDVVVPITFDERVDRLGYGGFGEVFRVHINPDHHSFRSDKMLPFALKRFFQQGDRTEGDFGNEAHMLSTLAGFKHQHITSHLASWTQGNTFYMLFPLAVGNLGSLLRSRQSPEHKNDFVLWLLTQLKGIADGLRLIHNLAPAGLGNEGLIPNPAAADERKRTGYHHDIKPANILVFADDNVGDREPQFSELCLKISDFGAARIHNVLSRSGMKRISHKTPNLTAGDEEYGAPDFALHAETSRPYDLWSLGCVFMEILLWAFRTSGSNIEGFANDRLNDPETLALAGRSAAFWHKNVRGHIALKMSVWIRLQQLRDYSQNKRVFKYIVDSTENLLTLLPAKRPDAPKICNEIDAALLQAAIDTEREDFYIDRIEAPLQFAAPPTAYNHRSRPPSIYERSVNVPEDNFLQAQGNSPQRSLHGRRESRENRSEEDNNHVAGTPDRQRLSPQDTQNMGAGFPRSRSPSISVYDVDGQMHAQSDALVDIELHAMASSPVAWRDTLPGPEDLPRRKRHHSSGSKSL